MRTKKSNGAVTFYGDAGHLPVLLELEAVRIVFEPDVFGGDGAEKSKNICFACVSAECLETIRGLETKIYGNPPKWIRRPLTTSLAAFRAVSFYASLCVCGPSPKASVFNFRREKIRAASQKMILADLGLILSLILSLSLSLILRLILRKSPAPNAATDHQGSPKDPAQNATTDRRVRQETPRLPDNQGQPGSHTPARNAATPPKLT